MTLEELLQISMDQVPNDESFIESLLQQVQAKLDAIDSFDPSTEPLEKKLLKLKFQLIYKIVIIRGDFDYDLIVMHEIKKVHHFSADQLKSALFEINEVLLFAKKTPLNIENLAGKIKNIKKTRKLFKKMLKTKIGLWHYFRYLFRR